jgi:hypothetical protein
MTFTRRTAFSKCTVMAVVLCLAGMPFYAVAKPLACLLNLHAVTSGCCHQAVEEVPSCCSKEGDPATPASVTELPAGPSLCDCDTGDLVKLDWVTCSSGEKQVPTPVAVQIAGALPRVQQASASVVAGSVGAPPSPLIFILGCSFLC